MVKAPPQTIVKTRTELVVHCRVISSLQKIFPYGTLFPLPSEGLELAQVANEIDSETITTIVAALLGVSAGIGVPVFFVMQV